MGHMELAQIKAKKTTKELRPSQAMRAGISKTDPAVLVAFSVTSVEEKPDCCALGAMAVGYSGMPAKKWLNHILEYTFTYPWQEVLKEAGVPMTARFAHPVNGWPKALEDIIADLNDIRGWSRESIADWLESIGL